MSNETQTESVTSPHTFIEGGLALLVDRRGRRYLVALDPQETFHSHLGFLSHQDIIGKNAGTRLVTSNGHVLLAFIPTFNDYVYEMQHYTQVIYPKDLGIIIVLGDIFPGARVLESGLGSGALTMALLRAVGTNGQVTTYEIREDLVGKAMGNIKAIVPNMDNLKIEVRDVYLGITESNLDRIILDVPEPWTVVPSAAEALIPGGIFLSYLPTILQVHQLHETLRESGQFELTETVEVLARQWAVSKRSVRPEHRMIGHTGFITTSRKCAPRNDPES